MIAITLNMQLIVWLQKSEFSRMPYTVSHFVLNIITFCLFFYLLVEEVSLHVVSGVFEKHKLGATEGTLCLENYDLEAVLSDIYFAANKQNQKNINIDVATELMLNFLYNIFDRYTGEIYVLYFYVIEYF